MLVALVTIAAACDGSGVPLPAGTSIVVQTTAVAAVATPTTQAALVTVETTAQVTQPAIVATIVATGVPTTKPTHPPSSQANPSATLMPLRERTAQFNEVWGTVKEHYLYTDFQGVAWEKIRIEYALKVAEAASAPEFYQIVSEMVGLLKDQHSRYIAPQEAHEEDALNRGDSSYAGVGILSKYEAKSALIVLVFPGSPAEGAGLKRRDRILAVDGVPMVDGEQSGIRGPIGTAVRLTVQSPGEEKRDVTLTRRAVTGKITASSERLEIDKSIGYLLIPSLWADDMAEQVEEQLEELLAGPPLKGLVIDLRANEGGWRPVLTGILGQLVQGDVGRFYSQESSYP